VYLGERRKWDHVFRGTLFLWGAQGEGRRVVEVRRFVAASRHLVKDRDNLVGGIKPLKDCLVRAGVLRDDRDVDVVFSVVQSVDAVNPRVEVEVYNEEV
jgi:Holliday junction resolvase RusA-like endonuclease